MALAQVSFTSRPIILVLTVAILIFLLSAVWQQQTEEKQLSLKIELDSKATSILDLLASSEDCLALKDSEAGAAYGYLVGSSRLDQFAARYADTEPECARNFQYGYRVTVKELEGRSTLEERQVCDNTSGNGTACSTVYV
ncbi:MAG: hypothetical protein HY519_01660, partial [Candidatus Aenigmarchaeota archaeon]|nr:hypothetical protein [Candidatus Aenigmarchaeota archaeon]